MAKSLPRHIKKAIDEGRKIGPKETIADDYVDGFLKKSKDWVELVYRKQIRGEIDIAIFSAMTTKSRDELLQRELKFTGWPIRLGFGQPSKYSGGDHYDTYLGNSEASDYFPIVFSRFKKKGEKASLELHQHFELYFNAFWNQIDKYKSELIVDDVDSRGKVIAVREVKNDLQCIRVEKKILKEYLAYRNCSLAQFHDVRFRDFSLADKREICVKREVSEGSLYEIDEWYDENEEVTGALLSGCSIIRGFSGPLVYDEMEGYGEFADFIIGLDEETGLPIISTCNPDKLNNFFRGGFDYHSLDLAHFERKCLLEYYSDPAIFKVDYAHISKEHGWGLYYGISKERRVQIYLKDLARLPIKEQQRLKSYNVAVNDTMTAHRYARDVDAESRWPTIEEEPIHVLMESYSNWISPMPWWSLFNPVHENDGHLLRQIRLPLEETETEFEQAILTYSRLFVDQINVKFLKSKLDEKLLNGINGGLNFLEIYIHNVLHLRNSNSILKPLRLLQRIRSSGAAHRKNSDYVKLLSKHNIGPGRYYDFCHALIQRIYSSFRIIIESMKEKHSPFPSVELLKMEEE